MDSIPQGEPIGWYSNINSCNEKPMIPVRFMRCGLFVAMLCMLSTGKVYSDSHSHSIEWLSLDQCSDWLLVYSWMHSGQADQHSLDRIALSPLYRRFPLPLAPQGFDYSSHTGEVESIFALQPRQIIGGEFNALTLRQRLQQLGFSVSTLSLPQSFEDLHHNLQLLSDLGLSGFDFQPEESLHVHDLDSRRRLLMLGANGYATGQGTLEHRIIESAGWRNYQKSQGFTVVDLEQVVADPPQAILSAHQASPAMANLLFGHPALRAVPRVTMQNDWRWQCAGPWSPALIDELAAWKN